MGRSGESACQRPRRLGIAGDGGSFLGRPNSGCMTCREAHYGSSYPCTELYHKSILAIASSMGMLFKATQILTSFNASLNVLGPIACVCFYVVKQTTNTELFSSKAVPTAPIADARRFVTEDTVLPFTRSRANWDCLYLHKTLPYLYVRAELLLSFVSSVSSRQVRTNKRVK